MPHCYQSHSIHWFTTLSWAWSFNISKSFYTLMLLLRNLGCLTEGPSSKSYAHSPSYNTSHLCLNISSIQFPIYFLITTCIHICACVCMCTCTCVHTHTHIFLQSGNYLHSFNLPYFFSTQWLCIFFFLHRMFFPCLLSLFLSDLVWIPHFLWPPLPGVNQMWINLFTSVFL